MKHQELHVSLDLQQRRLFLPPEMLFIDPKPPNKHLWSYQYTFYDIRNTFLWYFRLTHHSNWCETSSNVRFFGFSAKTAILPPEMLFIDLKLPNRHLEYVESTSYDILLTFFMIFRLDHRSKWCETSRIARCFGFSANRLFYPLKCYL